MKAGRAVLVLLFVLVGLISWDWALSRQQEQTRELRNRAGRLVPAALRDLADDAAAIRLDVGGRRHVYARIEGVWRCLSFQRAPADTQALKAFWNELMEGEGLLQTRVEEEARDLGFADERATRWTFHGRDMMVDDNQDELFGVELLPHPADVGRSLAKLTDSHEVWMIGSNPLRHLQQANDALPPLLDPFVVPTSWPGTSRVLQEILVVRNGTKHAHLKQRRRDDITPADVKAGESPFEWVLVAGGAEELLPYERASAYATLLVNLPYQTILEPDAVDLDVSTADVVLTVTPQEGAPLHLYVDSTEGSPFAHIRNQKEQLLFRIDAAIAELLAPGPDVLRQDSEFNPWREHLR